MKLLLYFMVFVCPFFGAAQPPFEEWIAEAEKCLRAKEYGQALDYYATALAQSEQPPYHLYNAACAAAAAGQTDRAFGWLFRRLEIDPQWYAEDLAQDNDLAPLHADARWTVLADSLHKRFEHYESRFDKPLRRALKEILRRDQSVRQEWVAAQQQGVPDSVMNVLVERMITGDSINQAQIACMLDCYGWLDSSRVGDATVVQFLVLQHAPLEMQIRYRAAIACGVETGDVRPSQYALFEDRLAVQSGQKQQYGTQILYNEAGQPCVAPCIAPGQVDSLRAAVGLPPMAQYLRRWGLEWEY